MFFQNSMTAGVSRQPPHCGGRGTSLPSNFRSNSATRRSSSPGGSIGWLWRDAQALVEAHRGQHASAERLAREAVQIGEQTEALHAQAETWADLGEVLMLAGRREEAAEAIEQALARYKAKESLVRAGWMRDRLAELRAEVG